VWKVTHQFWEEDGMLGEDGPLFNLKAVVQQTGLKPDTLRAWERRYNLPTPQRSRGGHRLYSQRDIDTIHWLVARQREGLSISRAVELWEQITLQGRDPLETPAPGARAGYPSALPGASGESLDQLREGWIGACLAFDEARAEQTLSQAFALYAPETVATELLQKAMSEIGKGWYEGSVTVQQEHFCSALAIRRLEALVMAAPPPVQPGRILAACPPEESHVFGLLLITFLLRRRGWEVIYLGANVPAERLETTVAAIKPQLVILAAQRIRSAATLLDLARLLEDSGIPLAYGGLIFNLSPGLRERIPGHFLGERLDLAPQTVETLLTAPRSSGPVAPVGERYRQARDHFRQRESLIQAQLVQAHDSMGVDPQHLTLAHRELALTISAALSLGDMGYMGTDLDWLKGLLGNRDQPTALLRDYLISYEQAAREHLDERGEPIVAWLEGVIHENGFDRVD
jgi:methanogenic corrinoid protein MtbC1